MARDVPTDFLMLIFVVFKTPITLGQRPLAFKRGFGVLPGVRSPLNGPRFNLSRLRI